MATLTGASALHAGFAEVVVDACDRVGGGGVVQHGVGRAAIQCAAVQGGEHRLLGTGEGDFLAFHDNQHSGGALADRSLSAAAVVRFRLVGFHWPSDG